LREAVVPATRRALNEGTAGWLAAEGDGVTHLKDARSTQFRLCFRSLFDSGRGYAFPCDSDGRVNLNDLSEGARNNYLYARAMVGREVAAPAVELVELR
jgi:hypothetical protein